MLAMLAASRAASKSARPSLAIRRTGRANRHYTDTCGTQATIRNMVIGDHHDSPSSQYPLLNEQDHPDEAGPDNQ
jgi:hypothetical protein